jgi:hypothetical protein
MAAGEGTGMAMIAVTQIAAHYRRNPKNSTP